MLHEHHESSRTLVTNLAVNAQRIDFFIMTFIRGERVLALAEL